MFFIHYIVTNAAAEIYKNITRKLFLQITLLYELLIYGMSWRNVQLGLDSMGHLERFWLTLVMACLASTPF